MSKLDTYTIANRPSASSNAGLMIFRTDTNSFEVSDGTDWQTYLSDGVIGTSYQNYPNNSYSAQFDGSNDYIDTGSKYDFIQQTSTFSISFWVKFTNHASTTAIQALLSSNYTSSFKGLYVFYDNRSGNKTLKAQNSASSAVTLEVNNGITDNDWHHIGITSLSGGNFKLYKDGSEIASLSAPATTTTSANNNLRIGRSDVSGGGHYFQGLIDEVAIFNTELSTAEVYQIYNNNSYSNYLAMYRFENNFNDEGGVYNASQSGGVSFSTDKPY